MARTEAFAKAIEKSLEFMHFSKRRCLVVPSERCLAANTC
jgi:hypothetical protein